MKIFNRYTAVFASAVLLALSLALPASGQNAQGFINRITSQGAIDAAGASYENTAGINNSYAASAQGLATAASATDIACLNGSSTKKIGLTNITISGYAGTAVTVPVTIVKRAAVDNPGATGTGNASPKAYPYWSNNPVATAAPTSYTTNPGILDTAPGILDSFTVGFGTSTTASSAAMSRSFGNRGGVGQPTLLASTEQVCVNFNTITVASPVINVTFEWTEY